MCEKKKPTIAELERMLDDDFCHIRILPSGEVTIDTENCPYRERCHASAAEAGEPAANSNYAAALKIAKEFRELFPNLGRGFRWRSYMKWLGSRLNSAEPNCA